MFTWPGLYFAERYGLREVGIGLSVLGYEIPGFFAWTGDPARS